MFYHAHNGSVRVGNSEMDYISFGNGDKNQRNFGIVLKNIL